MSTRTAVILAILGLAASFVLGIWWPQVWAAVVLMLWPAVAVTSRPDDDYKPKADDEIVDIKTDAEDSNARWRAAIRRAKRARADLRRRLGGDGGGANGDGGDRH